MTLRRADGDFHLRVPARPEVRPEAGETAAAGSAERIFLAAERLFAERGFDGVSVREIVEAAHANLAAVSYHFGSKSELMLAVFRLRAREMNRERHARLREAEARHGGRPPLTEILRALIGPPIQWRDPASGKATASRFIARALTEATPELRAILETDVSHQRGFVAALARALPDLAGADVCWAFHFANALPHQCTDTTFRRLAVLSAGACDVEDVADVLERAVRFAVGGVEALAAARATGISAGAQGEATR